MADFRTVGDVVAALLELPQDKPFVVADAGADEEWDVLWIIDTDNSSEHDDPEDQPTRTGVVEMLIDYA